MEEKKAESVKACMDGAPEVQDWPLQLPDCAYLDTILHDEKGEEQIELYATLLVELNELVGLAKTKELVNETVVDAIGRKQVGDIFHIRHVLLEGAFGTGKRVSAQFIARLYAAIRPQDDSGAGLFTPGKEAFVKKEDLFAALERSHNPFSSDEDATMDCLKVGIAEDDDTLYKVGVIRYTDGSPPRVEIAVAWTHPHHGYHGHHHGHHGHHGVFGAFMGGTFAGGGNVDMHEMVVDASLLIASPSVSSTMTEINSLDDLVPPPTGQGKKIVPNAVYYMRAQEKDTVNPDLANQLLEQLIAKKSMIIIGGYVTTIEHCCSPSPSSSLSLSRARSLSLSTRCAFVED